MTTNTSIDTINSIISKLLNFLTDNSKVYEDYQNYSRATIDHSLSSTEIQQFAMSYIFERKLDNNKTIPQFFLEKTENLTQEEKEVAQNLSKSLKSTFEIKKINKSNFIMYNLLNEKTYNVIPLRRMNHFRGIVPGQFLTGRILELNGEYYLIEITDLIPSAASKEVVNSILMQQLSNPELIYLDNEAKLDELNQIVEKLKIKFKEFFNSYEIITTSEHADELIGYFNDFFENDDAEVKNCPENLVQKPETYSFFKIEEIASRTINPIENASKGFSDHKQNYDVGIVMDNETGLLVLPFLGTFKQIFAIDDYTSINGYKDCVLSYFHNDKVPPSIIWDVYNNHKENFDRIAKEVLNEEDFTNIDSLINKYKGDYSTQKKYSTLTILYSSKVFNSVMENMDEEPENIPDQKIGRNDLCLCGSGKKYKKCCLK